MIVSRSNQKIKNIRRIRRCKGDHALLEGPHLVREALATGLEIDTVFATPGFLATDAGRRLAEELPTAPELVERGILDSLADADSPRGVLAVARLPRHGVERLELDGRAPVLYVDRVQDPGNLGALARAAEAFGAAALALSPGSVDPNHPRALRGSAGSLLRLPTAVDAEPGALADRLPCGTRWAALVPREGDDIRRADLSGPLILALGGEGPGLSPELVERADLRLTIPLAPSVESLNVTVAAAVALWEIASRRETD